MSEANECNFILSTSIKFYRNVDGVPFVSRFSVDDADDININVKAVCNKLWGEDKYNTFSANSLEADELRYWCERHQLKLNSNNADCAYTVFSDNADSTCIVTNETEHLLVQSICDGYNINGICTSASNAVNALSERIPFAASDKYGFVTSDPHYAGTAMKIDVLIHLPALTYAGGIDKLAQELIGKGAELKNFYADSNNTAYGAFYYITNIFTLGITEQQTLSYIMSAVQYAVDAENSCRESIIGNEALTIYDRIWRSAGVLALSYSMSFSEFLTIISNVRFGAESGILNISVDTVNELFNYGAEGYVARYAKRNDLQARASDSIRARIMRENMSPILKQLL